MKVDFYLKSKIANILIFLTAVLKKQRSWIFANSDYQLSGLEEKQIDNFIEKQNKGIPLAYIVGECGFYHLVFKVNPDVLIPRADTEILIDISLNLFDKDKGMKILDLGTGSGVIAITLKNKCPKWQVTATDISQKALTVAKCNADNLACNVYFIKSNWFDNLNADKFDLIISNPPYIAKDDKHLKYLAYEPKNALISGIDGLDNIRHIIANANFYLKDGGYLLLEHGYDQKDAIYNLIKNNFKNINFYKDINGIDRAFLGQKM